MVGMAVIECPTTILCHRSTDTETLNLWTSKNWAVMLFVRLWRNMVSVPQWKAEQTRALAKKSNKNKGSSTVDALPKDAIIKE